MDLERQNVKNLLKVLMMRLAEKIKTVHSITTYNLLNDLSSINALLCIFPNFFSKITVLFNLFAFQTRYVLVHRQMKQVIAVMKQTLLVIQIIFFQQIIFLNLKVVVLEGLVLLFLNYFLERKLASKQTLINVSYARNSNIYSEFVCPNTGRGSVSFRV